MNYRGLTIISCFLINIVYDLVVYFCSLSPDIYRLLIFRYTLLIGFGIYLSTSLNNKKDDIVALAFFVIGFIYIIINTYITPFPLFQDWKSTSMLCAPYAYGIMYYLMKYYSNIKYQKFFVFGRGSYHIFLTQMVFFGFGGWRVMIYTFSSPLREIIGSIISICICFTVGLCFYFVETKIRKLLYISH